MTKWKLMLAYKGKNTTRALKPPRKKFTTKSYSIWIIPMIIDST